MSVVFSPNGKVVVSGADTPDSQIIFWRSNTGDIVQKLENENHWSIAISADGAFLAAGGVEGIQIWSVSDVNGFEETLRIRGEGREVAFSPDNRLIAGGGMEPVITLWDINTGETVGELELSGWCWSLAFSPDGRLIAGGGEPDIDILEVATGKNLFTLKTYPQDKRYDANIGTFSLRFSPDGRTLATGGADNILRVWDVATGTLIKEYPRRESVIKTLEFSSNGKRLAVGCFRELFLLELESGEVEILEENTTPINTVSFSPNGRFLVSGGNDQTVKMWELSGG